jgi:multidrug resistance efflux pump
VADSGRLREAAQRTVRAPAAGVLGGVAPLARGDLVERSAVLATLVPDSVPQVVAWFPAGAAGGLRVGQAARMRIGGALGAAPRVLPATVAAVAPADQACGRPGAGWHRGLLHLFRR